MATPPVVLRGRRQEFPVHPVSSGRRPALDLTVTTWSTTTQPEKITAVMTLRSGDGPLSEPFPSWLCFAELQYVDGLGELTGAPGEKVPARPKLDLAAAGVS